LFLQQSKPGTFKKKNPKNRVLKSEDFENIFKQLAALYIKKAQMKTWIKHVEQFKKAYNVFLDNMLCDKDGQRNETN
jgi:hypothetical protein